jgi:predicted  nucleic acid-binding Zn-ribbon protein
MKLNKLLERLTELTDADRNEQLKQYSQLKKTLKQLRSKQKELEEKIASEEDAKRCKELEEKLKIVSTQRRKGLDLLKELRDLPGES